MVKHCENLRRTVHVVNLDPAAEHFDYPVLVGKFLTLYLLNLNILADNIEAQDKVLFQPKVMIFFFKFRATCYILRETVVI